MLLSLCSFVFAILNSTSLRALIHHTFTTHRQTDWIRDVLVRFILLLRWHISTHRQICSVQSVARNDCCIVCVSATDDPPRPSFDSQLSRDMAGYMPARADFMEVRDLQLIEISQGCTLFHYWHGWKQSCEEYKCIWKWLDRMQLEMNE